MGEFSDGFLTVVAVTAMLYSLRSLLSSVIQSSRYQRLMASTCSRNLLPGVGPVGTSSINCCWDNSNQSLWYACVGPTPYALYFVERDLIGGFRNSS